MITNLIQSTRNLLMGRSMTALNAFYDTRYPPTKFFYPNPNKITIKCILCGFPRTGTHWIRNVIEKSTGLDTYSVPPKKPLPVDKRGILVKIHARNKFLARVKALWMLPTHNFEGKYIYTYRDPRDAILSLYEKYKHDKGLPNLTPERFLSDYDAIGQFQWEISAWVMRKHDDVLVVRYEDLKRDSMGEFQRIFHFLNLEGEVREESVNEAVGIVGTTNRPRRTVFGWKSAPSEYQQTIHLISSRLDKELRSLAYEPL